MNFLQEYILIFSVPVPCATNTSWRAERWKEQAGKGRSARKATDLPVEAWYGRSCSPLPRPPAFLLILGVVWLREPDLPSEHPMNYHPLNYLLLSATSQHMCEHEGDFSGCPT